MEAVVHALDRFATSNQNVRMWGVRALRSMSAGHAVNDAKLEVAGGTHYLHIELSADEEDFEDDEDSAEEEDEEEDGEEAEEDEENEGA